MPLTFAELAQFSPPDLHLEGDLAKWENSRPVTDAFGEADQVTAWVNWKTRNSPQSKGMLDLFSDYRQRATPFLISDGALTAGLYLYAAGGEPYRPGAQALLDRLSAFETFQGQEALLYDWGLMEGSLIRRGLEGAPAIPGMDPGNEIALAEAEKEPLERWLRLLNLEVKGSGLPRTGSDLEWDSKARLFLRLAQGSPMRRGLLPGPLQERGKFLHTNLVRGLGFYASPEVSEDLVSRLSRQIARMEQREQTRLTDEEIPDLVQVVSEHLEALRKTSGAKRTPKGLVVTLSKLSFGGIIAFFHWLEKELSEIPDAGEIARTIANAAFTARDPGAQAEISLARWKVAYNTATTALELTEGAGEIARTIANAAFRASDPERQAKTLLAKWRAGAADGVAYIPEDRESRRALLKDIADNTGAQLVEEEGRRREERRERRR